MTTTKTPAALAIAARYLLHPLAGYAIDHRPGGAPWVEVTGDYDPAGRALTLTGGVVLRPRKGSGAVHRWTRLRFTGGAECGVWSGSELNAFTGLAPRKLPAPVDPDELPLGAVAARMAEFEAAPRGVTVSGTRGLDALAALAALAPKPSGYRYRIDGVHTTSGGIYATDGHAAIRLPGWTGAEGTAPTFTVARDTVAGALAAVKRYRPDQRARLVCSPDGGVSGVELHAPGGSPALFASIAPEGDYPNVDAVTPADGEGVHSAELPARAFTASELAAAGRTFRRAKAGIPRDFAPVVALTPDGAAVITGTPERYRGALFLDPTYIALAARALGFPLRVEWSKGALACRITGDALGPVAVTMPLDLDR